MKKIIAFGLLGFALVTGLGTGAAQAYVSVDGYYRGNGTYVAPHIRTSPDGNPYNNFSYGR